MIKRFNAIKKGRGKMNQYQFDQVVRRMQQKYGKIKKGDEDSYSMMMFPMEGNMLKKFRRNHAANGRRALEAVTLVLHTIEGYLTGKPADVTSFENTENVELREALLYAFDPFTNDELREIISQEMGKDLTDKSSLEDYYRDPVLCIMRIRDSIELWTKEMGSDGYFGFIEGQLGKQIDQDDKMNYTILVDKATSIRQ